MPDTFRDVFCQSADGLKLHAAIVGPDDDSSALPVVCLPGLTRTTADFDDIARALAAAAPRRVISIDYRGRGLSDYDPDPAKYNIPMEMGDVLAVLASLGVTRTIVLGTSRGGLISMVLAATQPQLLAGVILNDVGPALELEGLVKIQGYIADPPARSTWEDAARGLKALFGTAFPSLSDAAWMAWARRAFREKDGGGLERTYDLAIAKTLEGLDTANPPPAAWELFDKFAGIPLMLVHGGLSDLLSPQGVRDMAARRPDMEIVEVPDQGHAPLLADQKTIDRIVAFCEDCDKAQWPKAHRTTARLPPSGQL